MTDLFHITIPFVGRIYAQRDRITVARYSVEALRKGCGKEVLLCLGQFRLYLTPASSIAAEGR